MEARKCESSIENLARDHYKAFVAAAETVHSVHHSVRLTTRHSNVPTMLASPKNNPCVSPKNNPSAPFVTPLLVGVGRGDASQRAP